MALLPWRVFVDDDETDGHVMTASDPQEAAEEWARHHDWSSAEYDIVSGRSEPTVTVEARDGTRSRWQVRGESTPSYFATRVE